MLRSFALPLRTRACFQARFFSDGCSNPYLGLMVTSRRWLYNNEIQMSLRRLQFDVEALGAVAAKASGASECNKIEVVAEGGYNRIFRLGLSNGKNVIARIPFPNAGPRSLLTRSEVATMDFVRSRLGAPIPKVLAWDVTTDNGVGCEYIIMEKCDGSTLENRLDPNTEFFRHVYDIGQLTSGLASIPFSQYGSIYYKEDVDSHLQERPLYAEGEKQDECSERFRIGPSVERRFYRGERARMSIDRGPWKDINSYIKAAVRCEVEWIQSYSKSPHAQNQLGAQHSAEQHISLLQKWLTLAPAVLPAPEYCVPTLSHPDLHPGNIFVTDNDPMSVACIIDWQGATVRPLFQTDIPKFLDIDVPSDFKYIRILSGDLQQPLLPDNYEELTIDEREDARAEFKQVWPKHAFFKLIAHLHPSLLDVLRILQMELLRRAIYYSSHSWSDGLPLLEQALISLSADYGDGIPSHSNYPACPVVFSQDDVKRNEKEFEDIIFKEQWLEAKVSHLMTKDGLLVHPDGAVDLKHFDAAVKRADEIYTFFMTGKSQKAQEVLKRIWPMREGKFVLSMESCL